MADETKVENEEQETVDIEATVDELIKSKPAEKDAEDDGDQAGKKQQDSNGAGWLTSLPKELRDGVDTTKYSNLAEYIKDLKGNQKEAPATQEEIEEKWSKLFSDASDDSSSPADVESIKELLNDLKADGVGADDARKMLTIYGNTAKKLTERKASEDEKAFADYIDKNWSGNSKKFFDDATRGLQVIADENVDILKTARDQGLTKNPAFMEICRMLGSRTSESNLSKESRGGKTDNFDPRNPLGFEH